MMGLCAGQYVSCEPRRLCQCGGKTRNISPVFWTLGIRGCGVSWKQVRGGEGFWEDPNVLLYWIVFFFLFLLRLSEQYRVKEEDRGRRTGRECAPWP